MQNMFVVPPRNEIRKNQSYMVFAAGYGGFCFAPPLGDPEPFLAPARPLLKAMGNNPPPLHLGGGFLAQQLARRQPRTFFPLQLPPFPNQHTSLTKGSRLT